MTLSLFTVSTSSASDCAGYGNVYKTLKCRVYSSFTIEHGYTEIYGLADITIFSTALAAKSFDLGPGSGNLKGSIRLSSANNLELTLNKPVGNMGQSFQKTINFPQTCGTPKNVVYFTESYTADLVTHSTARDFTVDCFAELVFDKD